MTDQANHHGYRYGRTQNHEGYTNMRTQPIWQAVVPAELALRLRYPGEESPGRRNGAHQ